VKYKDYVDVWSKDMATLAPQLSRHPKGICEEERRRKRVRGNDRVPRHEEPYILCGFTQSPKEPVRSRAGTVRVHHCLRQHRSHLRSTSTANGGCVWTTELLITPRWKTKILSHWSRRSSTGSRECLTSNPNQGRRQVQNRVSHPVQAVRAPSHAVRVDERTSYHIRKQQYQLEEISRRQSNDL